MVVSRVQKRTKGAEGRWPSEGNLQCQLPSLALGSNETIGKALMITGTNEASPFQADDGNHYCIRKIGNRFFFFFLFSNYYYILILD